MSKVELFHRIVIRDKDGKIVEDSGLIPSNSYAIAFLEHIYGSWKDAAKSIEDTGGAARSVAKPSGLSNNIVRHEVNSSDNDDNYGIVVGTDDTVPTNEDYALGSQIAHGTGAGQLDYGANSFVVPSIVSGNIDMTLSRSFYNGSGSSIIVKEIGIYCRSNVGTGAGTARYFCLARDVLSTPEPVGDTKTLTIQYTIRTTV